MVLAWLGAWLLVGATHILARAVALPAVPLSDWPGWLAYDLGHFAVLGLATGGVVALLERVGPARSGWSTVGLGLVALIVALLVARPELVGPAERLAGRFDVSPSLLRGAVVVGLAAAVAAAWWAGEWVGAHKLGRCVLAVGAVAGQTANEVLLPAMFPAAHLFVAWIAATPLAAGLARAWSDTRERPFAARRGGRVVLVGALALAAATVLVPPGNAVRITLNASRGSVLFPYLAPWFVSLDTEPQLSLDVEDAWLLDRSAASSVEPTAGLRRGPAPVVLLLTVDAMRADLLDDPRAQGRLPNLEAFRDQSVTFERVWSPGAQTVYTLATVFSSRYYSQLYWTRWADGRSPDYWPHQDPTWRFPERLQEAGVRTVAYTPTRWLEDDFGVIRGFDEGGFVHAGRSLHATSHWTASRYLVDRLLARLAESGDEALFAYLHFAEPHEPYGSGEAGEGEFEGYVASVSVVDGQIGRLLGAIEALGLGGRATVIITSDHGEAFGEHGRYYHATTLYEEMVRVPLMVRGLGLAPRRESTPVSLIDLGPTILDLFGVETPGESMGQSLVPLLIGDGPEGLTRPIALEGREMRAVVFPDGLKVIVDRGAGTVEAYDLTRDPSEMHNLASEDDETLVRRVAYVRRFFDEHTLRRSGYELPDRH
jgi:arylsulfatase A-like enzyme